MIPARRIPIDTHNYVVTKPEGLDKVAIWLSG